MTLSIVSRLMQKIYSYMSLQQSFESILFAIDCDNSFPFKNEMRG